MVVGCIVGYIGSALTTLERWENMVKKELGRSGEFIDENGQSEFWWDGRNYGCILPEELIDITLNNQGVYKNEG